MEPVPPRYPPTIPARQPVGTLAYAPGESPPPAPRRRQHRELRNHLLLLAIGLGAILLLWAVLWLIGVLTGRIRLFVT